MYLLAILLPPVAVLMCGKPWQALLNCIFVILFYVPAVVHAVLLVKDKKENERLERQLDVLKGIK